jgi:hypothetical protein
MMEGRLSRTRGDRVVLNKKVLAIASGFVIGGFLFYRFQGLELQLSYQAVLLLGGFGLGGVFPAVRFWGPFGMSAAPLLIVCVQIPFLVYGAPNREALLSLDAAADALFLLALVSAFTFPAPLIGWAISLLLRRKRIPQFFYLAVLAITLPAGAVLPGIAFRHEVEAPMLALLRRVYQAEMSYRAGRPDGAFTCNGTELPGVGGLGWSNPGEGSGTQKFAESRGVRWHVTNQNNFASQDDINLILDCPDDVSPHGFRATAFSFLFQGAAPTFSIDETGKLTVSRGSEGQANSAPGRK